MYSPPKFMTVDVLADILREFTWPAPYTLEDELPDGIGMRFPKCELLFREGFESEMDIVFTSVNDEFDYSVTLGEAALALRDQGTLKSTGQPGPHFSGASLARVQSELRELCRSLQTTFRPTLEGDFGWVDAVKQFRAKKP